MVMKRLLTSTTLLLFSTICLSQQTNSIHTVTQDAYLKKSKRQKTTALVLAGGGLVLEIAGAIAYQKGPAGLVLFGAGLISQVVSIPIFIASGMNKRKSKKASLSFRLYNTPDLKSGMTSFHSNSEISLRLNW